MKAKGIPAPCSPAEHTATRSGAVADAEAIERCARIFRAMGETARMRLLSHLSYGPACVGELAAAEEETVATISQRLRVLRADNIVQRKRDGKHVLYFLADRHMLNLISNGLAHASESNPIRTESTASTLSTKPFSRKKAR